MRIEACFLDVDGVINDPERLPAMWDATIGHVLAPMLGGLPEDWSRANRETFPKIWARQHTWGFDPLTRWTREACENLTGMCRYLGVGEPTVGECLTMWRQVDRYVGGSALAAYEGVAATVRQLASRYPLHLATGNVSWRVEALLDALGVRDCVGFPCGPDLVGTWKSHPEFYRRLLELGGVEPAYSMVVDDGAEWIGYAVEVGARTAHIDSTGRCTCPATLHARTLADLTVRLLEPG